MNLFVLDACALLAVLAMEKGSDNIRNLFQKTVDHQANLVMNEELRRRAAEFFDREEKVLRTFLILYWGSAPRHPWLGIEPPQRSGVLDPPRIK